MRRVDSWVKLHINSASEDFLISKWGLQSDNYLIRANWRAILFRDSKCENAPLWGASHICIIPFIFTLFVCYWQSSMPLRKKMVTLVIETKFFRAAFQYLNYKLHLENPLLSILEITIYDFDRQIKTFQTCSTDFKFCCR